MKPTLLSKINIWFVYFLFTAIVFASVMYSTFLINDLRVRETKRIQIFGKAMKIQQANSQIDSDTQDLIWTIFTENDKIPIIVTDENKKPILEEGFYRNIPEDILKNPEELNRLIQKMGNNYEPFVLKISKDETQYVFYDNSQLLNNLRFYPYFLGLFVLLYLFFSIWFLRTIKKNDEGILWAGLAKETAHQIGTPLSSMIGWTEIMRMDNENAIGVKEIEKDIERLKTISERFSKIGSVPELNDMNLSETVQENYDYLKNRISTKVHFNLKMPKQEILAPHNRILLSWVIENLVKNAVDAMKGEGNLTISLYEKNKNILLDFVDTGSGMTNRQVNNAFKPGFSTKKRGWGLGLSFAKRVVNEYHNGDIKISQTEVGKGTTFRVILKKI